MPSTLAGQEGRSQGGRLPCKPAFGIVLSVESLALPAKLVSLLSYPLGHKSENSERRVD